MKNILILFITLVMVLSLSNCKNNDGVGAEERMDTISDSEENTNKLVEYKSGVYSNKKWEETTGTYQKDVVPNKDVALQIANTIFDGMEKNSNTESLTANSIFYDEEDEVWIINFAIPDNEAEDGSMIVGGDCNIAIQKKDGKILRIWFGE